MQKYLFNKKRFIFIVNLFICFSIIGCDKCSNPPNSNLPILKPIPQKSQKTFVEVLSGYQNINRCFFYYPVPEKISNHLLSIQNKLRQNKNITDNINWCEPKYFHISLAFPRNLTALQSKQISESLEKTLKTHSSITMELEAIPKVWSRVIVATVKNTPEIKEFEKNVVSIVKKYVPNYIDSVHPYTPHITLGYFKHGVQGNFKTDLSNKLPILINGTVQDKKVWFANEFDLGDTNQPLTSLKPYIKYYFN